MALRDLPPQRIATRSDVGRQRNLVRRTFRRRPKSALLPGAIRTLARALKSGSVREYEARGRSCVRQNPVSALSAYVAADERQEWMLLPLTFRSLTSRVGTRQRRQSSYWPCW